MTRRRQSAARPAPPSAAQPSARKPERSARASPAAQAASRASAAEARWPALLLLVLVVATIAAYHNSFEGVFLLDDQPAIVDNAQIRSLSPLGQVVAGSSRPVLQLSLALTYAAGGLDVRAYHAVNLLVHVLAGLALFGIVRRMLESATLRPRYGDAAPWLAMATAALWLVHPLQTESVTYVIQRAESLMGLFFLATIYCGIRASTAARPLPWGLAAVASCALGMGTKEVMVSAPLVMLLYDRTFVAGTFGSALRARAPLYAGLAATWLVLAVALLTARQAEQMFVVAALEPWQYLVSQAEVIVHYLRLALWPQPLVFDYAWQPQRSLPVLAASVAIVLALLAATLFALARRRWEGFWGAWFFLILGPTSSIMPIADVAFEHRMYLPLAAVVVLVVVRGYDAIGLATAKLGAPAGARVGIASAVAILAVVAAGLATVARNDDYRSAVAMWSDTVAKRPDNPRAWNNLGVALVKLGRIDEAVPKYAEAVRLKPDYVDAHNNLGGLLARKGRDEEAIVEFREAVRLRPDASEGRANLGSALLRLGRKDEAIAELTRAAELDASSAAIRNELGNALLSSGRAQDAATQYAQAVRLRPEFAEAHHNLGLALLERGDDAGALAQFSEAVRLKPDYAKARNNLGTVLFRQGHTAEAVKQFSEAVRIDPAFAEAQSNLQAARAQRSK